jgi:hypothetical protein
MIKDTITYFLSFFPLLIVLTQPFPQLIFLLLFFILIPFIGGFWRQLNFYDGTIASFGWIFLSYILSFQVLSIIIIFLILFWSIISMFFIYNKEYFTRRLEQESILISFKGKERPIDWPNCPVEQLKTWSTMVQGISKHRPLPIRVLLFNDMAFKTIGLAWETWYEAVIMLNKDFLKILPSDSQRALTAKYFGELLARNSTSLKQEIYWFGILISWSSSLVFLLIPEILNIEIFNEILFQFIVVILSIFVGYFIITFRLRREDLQSDLRASDFTNLNDIYQVYQIWEKNQVTGKKTKFSKFKEIFIPIFSNHPTIQKRKLFLEQFGTFELIENNIKEKKSK